MADETSKASAAEFVTGYALRSNQTVTDLLTHSRVVPCDCDYERCEGWGLVSLNAAVCSRCGHYDFHHPATRCDGYTTTPMWVLDMEAPPIADDPAPPFNTAKLVEHETHIQRDPACPVCWTVAHMHELGT